MISYKKAKELLDRLPVIEHFSPADNEYVTIERRIEKSDELGFDSRIRYKISGAGKYGVIGSEEIRFYFAYGVSDFFDNPNVKLIGKSGYDGQLREIYYVYSDNYLLTIYYEARVRLRSFLTKINRRILLTLRIWDFAEGMLGVYAQWSDVKILKKVTKWLKRK